MVQEASVKSKKPFSPGWQSRRDFSRANNPKAWHDMQCQKVLWSRIPNMDQSRFLVRKCTSMSEEELARGVRLHVFRVGIYFSCDAGDLEKINRIMNAEKTKQILIPNYICYTYYIIMIYGTKSSSFVCFQCKKVQHLQNEKHFIAHFIFTKYSKKRWIHKCLIISISVFSMCDIQISMELTGPFQKQEYV